MLEPRYIVIKDKDIDKYLTPQQVANLDDILHAINRNKTAFTNYVVIGDDWFGGDLYKDTVDKLITKLSK